MSKPTHLIKGGILVCGESIDYVTSTSDERNVTCKNCLMNPTNDITPSWKEEVNVILLRLFDSGMTYGKQGGGHINGMFPSEALNAIVEATKSKVIGENEPEFNTPQPDLPAMSRNRLREEQLRRME